jgi:hypothetical protein
MNSKKIKQKTAGLIDVMVQHADKGPSGFWTDDYEGCGNPKIFPEFNDGLKHGKYIRKEHYLCPWNTAVLYGEGHGNINTGCYHSCSIRDARYLSPEMLAAVLTRFKEHLQNGAYDDTKHIASLLTEDEQSYIKQQQSRERENQEQQWQKDRESKTIKAAALIQKYQDNEDMKAFLIGHYGDDIMVMSEFGNIDFSLDGKSDIVGGEKLSYDDYLNIQIQSYGKQRSWFAMCYYNLPNKFMGCIEKKTKNNVCFQRIYVSGMYPDGDCFEGKEDHVWMDIHGFEDFKISDSVSFYAEVYRYIKTGNGKILDYSLRNPEDIKQISSYELPSDDDLIRQSIDQIFCETCYLSEHCNKTYCLRNQEELQALRSQMFSMVSTK